MNNREYIQSLSPELFHATLCGLMGIELGDTIKEDVLKEWLEKDCKDEKWKD